MTEQATEPKVDTQTEAMGFHLVEGEPVVPPREPETPATAEDQPAESKTPPKGAETIEPTPEPEPKGRRVEYAEEEAADGAEDETPPAQFEPGLLKRAERWEMSEDEARTFESPEKLERFLSRLEQHAGLGMLRSRSAPPRTGPEHPADTPPTAPPASRPQRQAPESPPAESAYQPYEFAGADALLDPEKYETDFVQFGQGVKGLTNHVNTQLGGLNEQVQAMQEVIAGMAKHLRNQSVARELEEFHQAINGLDDEWKDTFGRGNFGEFAENSTHGRNRRKLLEAMRAIHHGAQAVGENGVPQQELMRRALYAAFHDKAIAQTEKQVEERLKQRRDQSTARPTARKGKRLTGQEAAVDYWNKARGS